MKNKICQISELIENISSNSPKTSDKD